MPIPGLIEYPINGNLDLHTFRPQEVKELIPDYLAECRKKGLTNIRIIHGKGSGTLRRIVHSLLSRHPDVLSFGLADRQGGSWGATVVQLRAGPKP
jgi:DNA-nicking Smr family endonuclease